MRVFESVKNSVLMAVLTINSPRSELLNRLQHWRILKMRKERRAEHFHKGMTDNSISVTSILQKTINI